MINRDGDDDDTGDFEPCDREIEDKLASQKQAEQVEQLLALDHLRVQGFPPAAKAQDTLFRSHFTNLTSLSFSAACGG